jgi:hypothetical protein
LKNASFEDGTQCSVSTFNPLSSTLILQKGKPNPREVNKLSQSHTVTGRR